MQVEYAALNFKIRHFLNLKIYIYFLMHVRSVLSRKWLRKKQYSMEFSVTFFFFNSAFRENMNITTYEIITNTSIYQSLDSQSWSFLIDNLFCYSTKYKRNCIFMVILQIMIVQVASSSRQLLNPCMQLILVQVGG